MAEASTGGRIASVASGSPAGSAGLKTGESILAADGHPLHDVLDWRWYASGRRVEVSVASDGAERDVVLQRSDESADWGVDFAEPLFDGIRPCANACVFCFVSQLPRGLRRSLYVKDDDYRLSFLLGNFVTLTNLTEADVLRILEQRLGPLHVSLHAVGTAARQRLMCSRVHDQALATLDRLMRGGIPAHLQIVLVPGLNDAEELEDTLSWASRRERVLSVGVVPMGFTSHQDRFTSSFEEPGRAAAVLERIRAWQAVMRVERGETWVQAADELYLAAGAPLPSWGQYDGFPQYDNGVGMARAFLDEVADEVTRRARAYPAIPMPVRVTLVTGTLFAPLLREVARRLSALGASADVLAVPNSLFGGNVSVAGLLGRADVVAAIRGHTRGGPYLVPDVVVNSDGLMLDDLRSTGAVSDTLTAEAGKEVVVVPTEGRAFVERLLGILETHREK